MSAKHDCPVSGCTIQVPDAMLMCRNHWGRVPQDLRSAVYRAYRARNHNPCHETVLAHLQACEDAIAHVEGREARELSL